MLFRTRHARGAVPGINILLINALKSFCEESLRGFEISMVAIGNRALHANDKTLKRGLFLPTL